MSFTVCLVLTSFFCVAALGLDRFLEKSRKKLLDYIPLKGLVHICRCKYADSVFLFLASFLILYLFNDHRPVIDNNHAYLAQSLLHGRLDVTDMPDYLESAIFNGKKFMHLAPGPVIFVLPFVAIWGLNFNFSIISIVLGALNAVIFYNILIKLGFQAVRTRLWLSGLLGFGTVHFFLAAKGSSWFLGQVSATFFILLAIYFILGKDGKITPGACFASGLFYGLATTCRIGMLFSCVFFAMVIWKRYKEMRLRGLLFFAAGAFIPGGLYMLYNYLRYGTIIDKSYELIFKAEHPEESAGPLQLKYIPFNLYSIFLMAPQWLGKYPYVEPTFMGVSLTLTTPALFYAVKAKAEKWLVASLWATVFLVSLTFLMNPGNGNSQFSMRYAMDFIPFLMLLVAFALKKLDNYKKVVILLCIWVNAWGVLYWNFFVN